ncbi:rhodanese-like domain-containing protein [Marinobacteraceae bacterium S3BR75-40.1]
MKTLPEIVAETKEHLHCLSPEAAKERMARDDNPLMIDVREPGEVQEKRVNDFINIPRGVLEMKIYEQTQDPERPIYLHCATGGRAALSAAALERMGFRNVHVIDSDCDHLIEHLGGEC